MEDEDLVPTIIRRFSRVENNTAHGVF